MLIDLHTHTCISSPCSIIKPRELIRCAQRIGLDGICVTEHNLIEGAKEVRKLGEEAGFPVFCGVEVRTKQGDVLVYGAMRDFEEGMDLKVLSQVVHDGGGVLVAAHPFRRGYISIGGDVGGWDDVLSLQDTFKMLDGIEIFSANHKGLESQVASRISRHLGLTNVGGSDAHCIEDIGAYVTNFNDTIKSEEDLAEAIRKGCCVAQQFRAVEGVNR